MFLFSSSDPDVTETIRFARSRKHCETDLDMTYKKIYETLEQEG